MQVKVRMPAELVTRLHKLHPAYGEAGRRIVELVRGYVEFEEHKHESAKLRKEDYHKW